MTCFWDGILKGLNSKGFCFNSNKELIEFLKNKNKKTKDVMWNNSLLREKEMGENYEAVENYNIKYIHNGHLCSCCDYMLLLICDIFCVNIDHQYLNKLISYKKIKNKDKLTFRSNRSHFWNISD